jgi:hypothetical protein
MSWRNGRAIYLAREPKLPLDDVWAMLRHYE